MTIRLSTRARRALLLAGLCVLAPVAGAQNLVGNPGFESNPPPNFGNNIGWTVTPWNIGPGNQSNVVKVDGGATYNYNNGGPALDADPATGVGVRQHYLDVASGANSFYQSFTVPACGGTNPGQNRTASFAGAFSTRDNLSGSGSVLIREGVGLDGNILGQQTVNLAAPPSSGSAPWTFVNGTVSVAAGTVVTFEVDMDNNVNFDEAFLGFTAPPCDTRQLTITKTWDGAVVNDTATLVAQRSGTTVAQLDSVANAANETDAAAAIAVYGGETITLTETLAGGNTGLYRAGVLACTGGATVSGTSILIPAGTGAITCGYTNTRQAADLEITKTNNATSLVSGTTATYDITARNLGPDTAVNAVLRDAAPTGLSACALGTPACSNGGTAAVCPTAGAGAGQLSIANLQSAGGVLIPSLPSGTQVVVRVACTVQ